ncbi:MAG: ligase-associated DNA damage response DEXH box helicase [Stagnimonas sp.]|nr:ligase-associated DNA damage response DEXH box helicase [Stagnimonas sp.]
MSDPKRIERWFAANKWRIADFQREAWAAYAAGESGLIHAPTGTGKTLAAWGGPLLEGVSADEPIRVVWVTPMRALAADTTANLQAAADALGVPWRIERRTGDTTAAQRAKQRKRLPQCLVTTPESLSLLLSYADLIPQWRGLKAVIVDEWHELLATKRGVQTELAISRLRALAPTLRVWGVSATLGNVDEAMTTLLGPGHRGRVIGADLPKTLNVRTLIPDKVERFPWSGHMGLELLPQVVQALHAKRSTLVFTNTRAQAERWHDALSMAAHELPIALHHGSLDSTLRAAAEQGLRDGSLRAVVATSSLDLGVDFSPVDQVIQIGGPKGIARLVQRAGRSGHQPGAASEILCVPANALELAEFAAARLALEHRRIESRRPIRLALDVLAQHVVTLALTGVLRADDMLQEVRRTHAYAELSEREWQWVLDFVQRGGASLTAYPQYRKVVEREGLLRVEDATLARRHRMSVGTITADSMMRVAFLSGGNIGQVEESFIARLSVGDSFLFGGRKLTLSKVEDMTAFVKAGGKGQTTPRYAGGKMPLSSALADSLLELFGRIADGELPNEEARVLKPLLDVQAEWSALPRPGLLLIERRKSREGEHLFVFPFAGRHAHEGLSALMAWRLARIKPTTFTFSVNDYGFELLARELPPLDEAAFRAALSPQNLETDLPLSLNAAEMAKRRFREIARVAGLVFEGFPGNNKSVKQVQVSSGLLFDVLSKYDADNLLTRQALSEVLEHQLDYQRLKLALERAQSATLLLRHTPRFSPLAFPLWAERISQQLSSEDWRDRVQRMVATLEKAAN